jgi:hypothetical protein
MISPFSAKSCRKGSSFFLREVLEETCMLKTSSDEGEIRDGK